MQELPEAFGEDEMTLIVIGFFVVGLFALALFIARFLGSSDDKDNQ